MQRLIALAILVILVIAGCSGDDGDTETVGVSPAEEDDADVADEDADPDDDDSDDGDGASSGATSATVSVGTETYTFAMDGDTGICNANFGGQGIFQASLYENGQSGQGQGLQLSLKPEDLGGRDEWLLKVGETWIADPTLIAGTGVDSATIEGNHAEGTATFSDFDGTPPVSGTFEVTCAVP